MRQFFTFGFCCGLWLAACSAASAQSLQFLAVGRADNGPIDVAAGDGKFHTANFGISSLSVYDARTPTSPTLLSVTSANGRPRNMVLNGSRVYLACYGISAPATSSLQGFDVSNPAAPVVFNSITLPPGVFTLAANGPLVCAACNGSFYTFEAATLSQLSLLNLSSSTFYANSIAMSGTLAYVVGAANGTSSELKVVDLAVPTAPVVLSTTAIPNANKVLLKDSFLYLSNGSIYDVSTPTAPVLRATLAGRGFNTITGSTAYRTSYDATSRATTVEAYSLAVPTAPTLAASIVSPNDTGVLASYGDLLCTASLTVNKVQVFQYKAAVLSSSLPAQQRTFAAYPSPVSSDYLTLDVLPAAQEVPVTVLNSLGQVVQRAVLPRNATGTTLFIGGLAAGAYVIKYQGQTQKIIRQ
jgi:hypothetical protein